MGWIIGLVLVALLVKVLWIVLVFAAPVLVPLALVTGGLFGVLWVWELGRDVVRAVRGHPDPPSLPRP